MKLLKVKDLSICFSRHKKKYLVLEKIEFDLSETETLGIVGESGSGKSVCAQALVKLLPSPPTIYQEGAVLYLGQNLFDMKPRELRLFRGKIISYVFQDPMSSLTPTMKVGKQILEALENKSKESVFDLLKEVGLDPQIYHYYPHELSGGQRQRIMIAIALAHNPKILIADEPTTALDVTIQAQILELLKKIQAARKMSIIFISHDLKIVAAFAHRILVIYGGKIIEEAPSLDLMHSPKHPYTKLLILSIPKISNLNESLYSIQGSPPDLTDKINGCVFAPRCLKSSKLCFEKKPSLLTLDKNRKVACWLYDAHSRSL